MRFLQEIMLTKKNDQVITRTTTLYWREHRHIMSLENGAFNWLGCLIGEGV